MERFHARFELGARQEMFAGERMQIVRGRNEGFFPVAVDAAGDEIGSDVESAVDDGDDMIEGPFARVQRAATIEAAMAVAAENARAEVFVAEMVGTRPGARLAVRVAERMKDQRRKRVGGRSGTQALHRSGGQALENFVGEKHGKQAAGRAAVHKTDALLARQQPEIVARGGWRQS